MEQVVKKINGQQIGGELMHVAHKYSMDTYRLMVRANG